LVALLALCLAGFAAAQDQPQALADSQWDDVLAGFEALDKALTPPPRGVVFVGSSSIRLWDGLEGHFGKPNEVIKRGFGGSRLSDCVKLMDRLVLAYQPRLVLLYAGDNDLAEGRSPAEILKQFSAFAEGVQRRLPQTRVAFISIKPSPARRGLIGKARTANALVRDYVATRPQLEFIDVFTPMLDNEGMPRADLFRNDGLHLDEDGYALWREVIKPYVR
jgi:lysophospholipase L1-like esterase